ncbi:Major facilitator superfamily (MFS) transporter [Fulvivirga imtechensis AK7]|uniref:Major facilitator superfamily (MFS) transporter n=1 Tax=Fulvivirga imtechensis AK7 TaxID=1237149 RepID=L8JRV0_9BACT|nr:MFS transporter [Fulvivirga imtechensis]ELR71686.1 Major facilitator superfamily (MFS) transporter [Fulvivirga imtechensis AK7]
MEVKSGLKSEASDGLEPSDALGREVKLGLRENWKQFTLLVIINGFVGGMVGLERTILPQIAEADFSIAAKTAILSFIVVFGISKAITNYYTGAWANKIGRKNLLVIGWLVGLPVPLILIYASSWNWIIAANILLGINQGLTWSSTVVMKIDLVGERNRGLAMGLNESAGYLAVGIVAFLTGWMASEYGLRPYPFYLGIGFVIVGLLASFFLIKDTAHHVSTETKSSQVKKLKNVFRETTWTNPNLGSITQAGLVNNLNDGMIWGLFPILLANKGFSLVEVGKIVAIYPVVWGLGQLVTGKLADMLAKKSMLFWGMLIQGAVIVAMVFATSFIQFTLLSILLGIGTAIVYPTFLAAIADYTHPVQRANSIGVFRLWRDLGYAIGAILTGITADFFGIDISVILIGGLTVVSALVIGLRMKG